MRYNPPPPTHTHNPIKMGWEWLGAKDPQMSGCRVMDVASGVSVRAETRRGMGESRSLQGWCLRSRAGPSELLECVPRHGVMSSNARRGQEMAVHVKWVTL